MKQHTSKILAIGAVLLVAGCFSLPIGYYTFLRITTFIISVVCIVLVYDSKVFWQIAGLAVLAIIFNPFLPIYLPSKAAWVAIDACGAIFMAITAYLIRHEKGKED